MSNLWSCNHPRNFWLCQPDFPDGIWEEAITRAMPLLEFQDEIPDVSSLLEFILGEARFGPDHWTLSLPKKIYYHLKPVLPRFLTRLMRRGYQHTRKTGPEIQWPVDQRYVVFLWDVLAQVLSEIPGQKINVKALWPSGYRYSFVLTHDVETKLGVEYVRKVADMEEELGFRSSFNFVPERYKLDLNLIDELRTRGFEIGIHGLKHDGKLFNSRKGFERRANKINHYLKEFDAVGFRTPLTHRNPEWMQALDLEYDLSFFDTDPFEPIPGGSMSIWPFFIGRFVELPYTLVQDYTLTSVLGETTPKIWLDKVEFIEKYFGMALLNSHPDYLAQATNWDVYHQFLLSMKERNGYWQALPREVASWWRRRTSHEQEKPGEGSEYVAASLQNGNLVFDIGA